MESSAGGKPHEFVLRSCSFDGSLNLYDVGQELSAGTITAETIRSLLPTNNDQPIRSMPSNVSLIIENSQIEEFLIVCRESPLLVWTHILLRGCTIQTLIIDGVIMAGTLAIEGCEIDQALVQKGDFLAEVSFAQSRFARLFQDFDNRYSAPVSFEFAHFDSGAYFAGTESADRFTVRGVAFGDAIEFDGVGFGFTKDEQQAHLLASRAQQQAGNQQASLKHWRLYRRAQRKDKHVLLRVLEFVFLDLTCGYGTIWERVLLTWCSVILLSTVFYWWFEGLYETQKDGTPKRLTRTLNSLPQCLYFSVVTFTTLGYGDLRARGHARTVAALEALLGACLLSLFVVVLSRVYL